MFYIVFNILNQYVLTLYFANPVTLSNTKYSNIFMASTNFYTIQKKQDSIFILESCFNGGAKLIF